MASWAMRMALGTALAAMTPPAAGQTPKLAFDHVAIGVADLQKSVDFYRGIFGLAEIKSPFPPGGPRWLDLGGGLSLHIQPARTAVAAPPRIVHFAIAVADLDALTRKLSAKGIAWGDFAGAAGKINTTRSDGVRQIFLQDPDGYWIEINDKLKPG